MSEDEAVKHIQRPDITTAQIVLLIMGTRGKSAFQEIINHPTAVLLGKGRTANSFYTALSRLKRRRHIVRSGHFYELTTAGQYAVLKAYIRKELTGLEKKREGPSASSGQTRGRVWDGKWRVMFFDMPESKRPLRDYLRNVLKRVGFAEFQRSIWIWPYQVPAFVSKLLEDPIFRPHTKLLTTYDIDYDDDLRKKFKLVGK